MARLYSPLTWLEKNAKPSWKLTLTLCPMHYDEDAQKIEAEQHDLTGKEAHLIDSLWRGYEDELPAAGKAIGIEDLLLSVASVIVRIPRRHGGFIKHSMVYDHHEDSWFDCYNPPDTPKDKPIQFAELMKLGKKKKPAKKKPVKKKAVRRKPRKAK